ncbi:glycosyltransferase family A protein [Kitasatospora purpeofusca]|uniref:glycosyltransferase family 2 protein n=1 Tax=Kitasatospora purpeofusca TaxID=67352 RepID=UPI0033C9E4DE
MKGSDRRTDAACPRPAARDSLYTPVRVVDLDLDEPSGLRSPGGSGAADPEGRVLALVRLHGHPLGLVTATGTAGATAALRRALVDAAHRELHVPALSTATPAARPSRVARARVPAGPVTVSVVVCTRDRTESLRSCLDSLLRTGYPHTEVLVVDNAPRDDATERLVAARYRDRVRYLREPVPGLARARNRGLAAAGGEVVAFADDDLIIDADWVGAIARTFGADDRIGCVTGLVLPAELETPAQVALEQYGGYSRGFAARDWSLRLEPDDPLVRFSVGRFGSGANMAFRTAVVRGFGGFDPATGAGTPARGGEELLAFFQTLDTGHTVAYQPDAIVWHRHPRTADALGRQVFNFGVGFGAYLTAAVARRPGVLLELARRVPGGLRQWQRVRRDRARCGPAGRELAQLRLGRRELGGMLVGPFGYAVSVWRQRGWDAGGLVGPGRDDTGRDDTGRFRGGRDDTGQAGGGQVDGGAS